MYFLSIMALTRVIRWIWSLSYSIIPHIRSLPYMRCSIEAGNIFMLFSSSCLVFEACVFWIWLFIEKSRFVELADAELSNVKYLGEIGNMPELRRSCRITPLYKIPNVELYKRHSILIPMAVIHFTVKVYPISFNSKSLKNSFRHIIIPFDREK